MKKLFMCCVLLFVFALCGCGEITQDDINGKYFDKTNHADIYYLFSDKGVEIHNEGSIEKCKNYKLQDGVVSFKTESGKSELVYEDGILYTDNPMKGEIPDGDRINTQCEFTKSEDGTEVNSIYKFSEDGTLKVQNTIKSSILGEHNLDYDYYYQRKENLFKITDSSSEDVFYLYTKDKKLFNDVLIKETEQF